jgi:hypothetical protein
VDATSKGSKKGKSQPHTGLSNTTQFFRGRRVLRSGGPNHVNLGVHCVHL